MKISKTNQNGRERWRVSWRSSDGTYRRRFFRTQGDAKTWANSEADEKTRMGAVWLNATAQQRMEMAAALERSTSGGYSIREALDAFEKDRGTSGQITVEALVEAVLKAKEAKGIRERSLRALRSSLRAFAQGRESVPASKVTPQDVQSFIGSAKWGARRRRGVLTDLGTAFNHALRMGYVARNPCAAVERPILEATATPVLTPDQTERLFRQTETQDPELLGFLALAAFGGFRTESEVERMTRADVVSALQTGSLTPPVENKTRRRRIVPVLPCLRAWLTAWIPLNVDPCPLNFRWRWQRVREAAGIVPWPQNVLRHSRVSYRLAQTGDEVTTAAEDGHSAAMLHANYKALVTREDAERYFGILPSPAADYGATAAKRRKELKLRGGVERMGSMTRKRWVTPTVSR